MYRRGVFPQLGCVSYSWAAYHGDDTYYGMYKKTIIYKILKDGTVYGYAMQYTEDITVL